MVIPRNVSLTGKTHPMTINTVHQRLRGPLELVVPTGLTLPDASDRLQRALAERSSIESRTDAPSDRRLAGMVSGATAVLSIRDARLVTRRKSWNVEFRGILDPTPDGTILRGMIDIPDRRPLHVLMWMFRIATGVIAILAVALAARDLAQGAPVDVWPTVAALVGLPFTVFVTARMEADGERAAAEDAELLAAFLRRTFA